MRKNKAEEKTYILTGFRYRDLRPLMYSFERKPGLATNNFKVLKNLPSK
jgi:hypothetical protein